MEGVARRHAVGVGRDGVRVDRVRGHDVGVADGVGECPLQQRALPFTGPSCVERQRLDCHFHAVPPAQGGACSSVQCGMVPAAAFFSGWAPPLSSPAQRLLRFGRVHA